MKKKSTPIKPIPIISGSGSIIFARGVVYLVALGALAVCLILLPELAREEAVGKPSNPYMTYGFLICSCILSIPFFIALYQTLKLLEYVEKEKAFSTQSIWLLQNIKICSIVFSVLIVIAVIIGLVIARVSDPTEDVTFIVTLGFLFTFVSSLITIFVAVLQKLLADAVALKSENDLIV